MVVVVDLDGDGDGDGDGDVVGDVKGGVRGSLPQKREGSCNVRSRAARTIEACSREPVEDREPSRQSAVAVAVAVHVQVHVYVEVDVVDDRVSFFAPLRVTS